MCRHAYYLENFDSIIFFFLEISALFNFFKVFKDKGICVDINNNNNINIIIFEDLADDVLRIMLFIKLFWVFNAHLAIHYVYHRQVIRWGRGVCEPPHFFFHCIAHV